MKDRRKTRIRSDVMDYCFIAWRKGWFVPATISDVPIGVYHKGEIIFISSDIIFTDE